MTRAELDISAGRAAFGEDPAAYHAARPPYPDALFEVLKQRCGLGPGVAVLEIGPGTGIATERLLAAGARPLLAIEPDLRLAAFVERRLGSASLDVLRASLEDAQLPQAVFDLGVAATSFHWLDQASALAKTKTALRHGGWWAMWWTNFGEEGWPDPFQAATRHLFVDTPRSPAHGRKGRPPFALDREARLADLAAAGFADAEVDYWRWTLTMETSRLCALYATYSPVQALPPTKRAAFLADLAAIADRDFGGAVERPFSTILYTARRPGKSST
ncbi:MAG TPA: methyltransferase domain-containing protein [Caulobacteraceae bacterium]|jgi:SAM-dependent methyltransferase